MLRLRVSSAIWMARRDWCSRSDVDPNSVIPIGCHGDGVPNSKRGYAQVFSWNLLAGEFADRFLFSVIAK